MNNIISTDVDSLVSNGFISSDLTQINLPIPLGTPVYRVNTGCCDACTFHPDKSQQYKDVIFCGYDAACHTKALMPDVITFHFTNMESVLSGIEVDYFVNKNDAEIRTRELVEGRIACMRLLGFPVRDDGTISSHVDDVTSNS